VQKTITQAVSFIFPGAHTVGSVLRPRLFSFVHKKTVTTLKAFAGKVLRLQQS
jgi:hypothetical protein